VGLSGRGLRRSASLLALVLPLLASGCATYLPQTTLQPTSDFGDQIDWLFRSILWWEIGIFILVEGALLFAVLRFRRSKSESTPPQHHGHTGIEVAWTLAPALILVFIGVPTVATIFRTQAAPPAGSLNVQVIGHQWWWEFRYPELGIITANEVHVPQGRPVHFEMSSADVIHSFWIPRLGGKRDVFPNRTTHLWMTPDSTGMMPGQCVEFCGTSHANMRLLAVVDSPADFEAWTRSQKDTVGPPTDTLAARGAALFQQPQKLCTTCHTVAGVSMGLVGPNLSHVGSRHMIAAGLLENTPENVARWIQDPSKVKPGALMPTLGVSPDDAKALAAYLESRK
jgi:cytochrome c oxidase subunit II